MEESRVDAPRAGAAVRPGGPLRGRPGSGQSRGGSKYMIMKIIEE